MNLAPAAAPRLHRLTLKLTSRKGKILHPSDLFPSPHAHIRENNIVDFPKFAWIVRQCGVSFPH